MDSWRHSHPECIDDIGAIDSKARLGDATPDPPYSLLLARLLCFPAARIVSKRRANARVKAVRSKAKAPPPGAKVNGRNIIHLLFEAVASTVHGLSFKGHHELWPDAVD
jgi:hypothetical protein